MFNEGNLKSIRTCSFLLNKIISVYSYQRNIDGRLEVKQPKYVILIDNVKKVI